MSDQRITSSMGCRSSAEHAVIGWRAIDANGTTYGAEVSRWCVICNDYVSWGPANDTAHALVELRAAEIAATWKPIGGDPSISTAEYYGWASWGCEGRTLYGREVVGYLARCILDHDTSHAPAADGDGGEG